MKNLRMMKIFNESGKGYWMEGFGCLRAEGENRPSRPTHVVIFNDQGGSVMNSSEDVTACLRAQDHGHPPVICFEPGIAKREGNNSRFVMDKCGTLRADMGDNQPAVVYAIDSHPMDSRFEIAGDVSPTVTSKLLKGSADGPLVMIKR